MLPNVKIVIDGDRLDRTALAEIRPFVIKPNLFEFQALTGLESNGRDEIVKTLKLHDFLAENILLSAGGQGIYFLSQNGDFVRAKVDEAVVKCTVGAGDASLAGFLACVCQYENVLSESPEKAAFYAAAAGTAAVGTEGTGTITRESFESTLNKIKYKKEGI